MAVPILNIGSLNIDNVYRVGHFVRPGETIASLESARHPGGKGLNQSLAAARAGARVIHFGKVGIDGELLVETLEASGVDVAYVERTEGQSGHAFIQVDTAGQNAILIHGGANRSLSPATLETALASLPPGSLVLTQNETNLTGEVLRLASGRGMRLVWNPAPLTNDCSRMPWGTLAYLVVNETEGRGLAAVPEDLPWGQVLERLAAQAPQTQIVLTLGGDGVASAGPFGRHRLEAERVARVVDTTAAGDTFIGYLLASLAAELSLAESLVRANKAAALCVARRGAAPSIPWGAELR